MVPSCAEGGVLGVLCASIGSIQVTEAIKLITGIGEPLVGRLMVYDALEMSYRTVGPQGPRGQPITGSSTTRRSAGRVSQAAADAAAGPTISVKTLKLWLEERERGERDFVLVDVREPDEYEINRIPGAVLIPKGGSCSGTPSPSCLRTSRSSCTARAGCRSAEVLAVAKGAGWPTPSTSAAGSAHGSGRSSPSSRRTETPRQPRPYSALARCSLFHATHPNGIGSQNVASRNSSTAENAWPAALPPPSDRQ
jgi:sulfur-carrier protein adenylyltransferase/sulfurtransferase